MVFKNRSEAGKQLANKLANHPLIKKTDRQRLLVLSIPRGGVVVGAAIARELACAHNVLVAKKIGFPGHPEAAIGALAEDGPVLLDTKLPEWFLQEESFIKPQVNNARKQIAGYINHYRQGASLKVGGKTVIVVDDGIATGETMKAAILWLKSRAGPDAPTTILIATPVCAPKAAEALGSMSAVLLSLSIPPQFWAVSQFYHTFKQVDDDEVLSLLSDSAYVTNVNE
jgi:predicted phosphoribosyltransferase